MDDSAGEAEHGDGSNSDLLLLAAVGFAHVVGIGVFAWCCCRCCCRKAPPPPEAPTNAAQTPVLKAEHLQPRKRLLTSYILWLCCGPIANAHHFYLGRIVHGLVGVWTANFLVVGWLLDAVLLPYYVYSANARYVAPTAPYDSTIWRLFRLPMMFVCLILLTVAAGVYLPSGLHRMGFVDLDRMAAQTEANPYDVLEIPRGADLAEAKSAYRKASLRWHPDRNIGCGKPCEVKMSEITKAFDLIKKRRAPADDRTWASWFEERGADWMNIMSAFSEESKTSQGSKAKTDL